MILNRKKLDLTTAKVSATLFKFFKTNSLALKDTEEICNNYFNHKIESDRIITTFNENIIGKSSQQVDEILCNSSLFYSYCFDYYKLLPIVIALKGYRVTVLVEDRVQKNQNLIFEKLIHSFEDRFGKKIDVEFLTNADTNIIFKLRSKIQANNKVIVYVDGNRGSNDKLKNQLLCRFKDNDVYFHQGFGLLCYLLKQTSIHGLFCRNIEEKLILDCKVNKIDFTGLDRDSYIKNVTGVVVNNLDDMINLNNIHKWDALVSLYQWLPDCDADDNAEIELDKSIPFVIDSEYYVLNKENFLAHQIDKKLYKELLKHYE